MLKLIFHLTLIFTAGSLLYSCKDASDYTNKAVQEVKIGDEVRIYYTTNSCCAHCSPNKDALKHLKYLREEEIIPSSSNCDGCGYTNALVFEAKSIGSDTILSKIGDPMEPCADSTVKVETFVINVR